MGHAQYLYRSEKKKIYINCLLKLSRFCELAFLMIDSANVYLALWTTVATDHIYVTKFSLFLLSDAVRLIRITARLLRLVLLNRCD